ncbi:maltose acetyltransferase domain-containing protein [Escherichia coli]|uniref:maltose acetyltransferase domain-containing protein n=1 Tax=Escherichia coli TaxID=562 RepID=UPI000946877C
MRRERLIRPTYQGGMIAMNMSMTERIKAGKLFTDMCEGLPEKRLRGKTLMYEFNHSHPSEFEKRESLIKEMFATVGENAWVDPPSISLTVPTSI